MEPKFQAVISAYGEPVNGSALHPGFVDKSVGMIPGNVAWSGDGRPEHREKRCTGKNDSCMGWKQKDSLLCAGCQRSDEKAKAETVIP
jgi:hypothetical protein